MYNQEQLNGLIADVTVAFADHLAKAEKGFTLAKAEDSSKKEPKAQEEKKPEESKGPSKPIESEKPADKGAQDQNQQEAGAKPLPKEGEPNEPQAADKLADGQNAGHGYDDEDMNHMQQMYGSMSREELKAHHDCIRKCMDGMGLAKCEDSIAKAETGDAAKDADGYRPNGGPTDGEAAKSKTPASSDAQALNKSEPSIEIDLIKSELSAEKAKSEDLKKNLEAVQAFLTKFVEKTAPAGKAITSLDIIAKTEGGKEEKNLSKSEIHEKLLAKSKDATLTKADRDAINSYYFSKNIEQVRHLLS